MLEPRQISRSGSREGHGFSSGASLSTAVVLV
jgi:hypothetical protein